jgi:CheY-like chemotaxis protein
MTPLSILLVDDEEHIRLLMQQWLEAAGYRVTCAASSQEAAALIARAQFDLAITDILMPERDGIDLIAALKKVQPAARILAISGGGRSIGGEDCLKIALGLGAHAAIAKPFDQVHFMAGVELALAPPRPPGLRR